MSLSKQSPANKGTHNNGTPGRSPKPNPKSKLKSVLNPGLVKITDKSVMLAKMKNSSGKPALGYAYKVQKLKNYGKKLNSPRTPKTGNAKDIYDDDFPTLDSDDEDLTPRNKDEHLTTQNSYENTTQNNNVDENDIEGKDNFLCVWQEPDTLSLDSELTDSEQSSDQILREYLYFENQTTVEVSFNWNNFNAVKREEQGNNSDLYTEIIRIGNKTFRSQQTSTNDLFKLRKLSVFACTILQKCHELERMQFNITGSSSQGIICMGRSLAQPRLPTIPEENAPEDAPQMSQDYSDKKLTIYKDEGKARPESCPRIRNANPNSMWHFILAIIGLIMFIAGIIYIRYEMHTPEPPKPLWQQYLIKLINLLYFYK